MRRSTGVHVKAEAARRWWRRARRWLRRARRRVFFERIWASRNHEYASCANQGAKGENWRSIPFRVWGNSDAGGCLLPAEDQEEIFVIQRMFVKEGNEIGFQCHPIRFTSG